MLRRVAAPVLAISCVAVLAAQQANSEHGRTPETIDAAMNARIRAEALERSQVMRIVQVLTDRYGGRLTGSPNYQNAAEWAVKELASWGMANAHLEPWDWGREGWANERATGHIVAPIRDNLVFEVVAWTKSTNGVVTAPAVNLVVPEGPPAPPRAGRGGAPGQPQRLGPTEDELSKYLATMASKVNGAIVLVGAPRVPAFVEVEEPKRRDDEQMRRQFNPTPQDARVVTPSVARGGEGAAPAGEPPRLSPDAVSRRVRDFLKTNGAAVRVNDAGRRHGQIVVQGGYGFVADETIPTVVLRNEDYGRVARLLADDIPVTLEFNIVNRTYPDALTQYNVIAEIPGTDKADEVVMLGAHFDSWHGATGATDNAVGSAIMMEAVRILRAVGARPRRTIRVALWGGEEQGLLGSQAYVREHFGSVESPTPAFAKLSAYWNIDTGTGQIRGASVFGPPESARILAELLTPWTEFKVHGATTSTNRVVSGTDHTSFNSAGLPGIGTTLDPIEYNTHTHHFNLDTYERVLPNDVKANSIVTASVVYHLAMRDELMPRFPPDQMPARPKS